MEYKEDLNKLAGCSCEEELLENIVLQDPSTFTQYIGTLAAIYQRRLWHEVNGMYKSGLLRLKPLAVVLDYWPHSPIRGYIFWEDGSVSERRFPISGGAFGEFSRGSLQEWVDDISIEYQK